MKTHEQSRCNDGRNYLILASILSYFMVKFARHFLLSFLQALAVYLFLSVNWSFELCYFSTSDSGFCRPFPSHITSLFANKCFLVWILLEEGSGHSSICLLCMAVWCVIHVAIVVMSLINYIPALQIRYDLSKHSIDDYQLASILYQLWHANYKTA